MRSMRPPSPADRALGLTPWIGIGALVLLLVVVAVRLAPRLSENDPLPLPPPPLVLPGGTTQPGESAPGDTRPPTNAGPTPGASGTGTTSRPVPVGRTSTVPAPTTKPAPPPAVTGRYRVIDSYPESFIGEVLITNTPGADRAWTVVLTFPSGVGDLRTSWLEGLPQPTLTRNGQTYTWRSTTPLAAGASGQLRFHFERSGQTENPSRCTTNGRACR